MPVCARSLCSLYHSLTSPPYLIQPMPCPLPSLSPIQTNKPNPQLHPSTSSPSYIIFAQPQFTTFLLQFKLTIHQSQFSQANQQLFHHFKSARTQSHGNNHQFTIPCHPHHQIQPHHRPYLLCPNFTNLQTISTARSSSKAPMGLFSAPKDQQSINHEISPRRCSYLGRTYPAQSKPMAAITKLQNRNKEMNKNSSAVPQAVRAQAITTPSFPAPVPVLLPRFPNHRSSASIDPICPATEKLRSRCNQ
ncbi:hypothetical protein M0R45_019431 [Rubus argutus]|uniref:Uncharacterized protein n=1 Tax=Rubus argutus TaxID=59490 RepID=A0AAW1X7B3_RUBAR